MDPRRAEQFQEFQKENSRLKKLEAVQTLDMLILEESARPHACVAQVNLGAPIRCTERRRRRVESVRR
jgi:hypothetical protein